MKKSLMIILFAMFLMLCRTALVSAQTSADELLQKYREEAAKPGTEIMFESESYITLNTDGKKIWRAPFAGIVEFEVPEEWIKAEGGIRALGGTELDDGIGIVNLNVNYIPSEEAVYKELVRLIEEAWDSGNDVEADELYDIWSNSMVELFTIYGISDSRDEAELRNALEEDYISYGYDPEDVQALISQMKFTKLGSADDFNFFFAKNEEEDLSILEGADEKYVKEYREFSADPGKYIPNFTKLDRPLGLTEIIEAGSGISFETKYLSGEPADTAEIFGKKKVTMVNIWSTTCGFCIGELPDLVKLNKEFEPKGAQIISIVYDAVDEDTIRDAKDIVDDLNVDYAILLPTPEIKELFKVQAFPCTYFVNEKGEILGEPVFGPALSEFSALADKYLAEAR